MIILLACRTIHRLACSTVNILVYRHIHLFTCRLILFLAFWLLHDPASAAA